MKKITISSLLVILFITACTEAQLSKASKQLGDVLDQGLSTEDVVSGLKEALVKGTSTGTSSASKINGFYKNPLIKIPFPPKVQKVETRLRSLGMNKMVDDFVLSINRGAEDAAKGAKPIFVNAIKSMTISDAWNILKGEKNAATQYLKRTTSTQLYNKFNPVIVASLKKVNATKYYGDVVNTYNKIPLVEKVNPDLDDYVTNRAMDGLFSLIEKEELNIRENPIARTTELLKKVFSQQD